MNKEITAWLLRKPFNCAIYCKFKRYFRGFQKGLYVLCTFWLFPLFFISTIPMKRKHWDYEGTNLRSYLSLERDKGLFGWTWEKYNIDWPFEIIIYEKLCGGFSWWSFSSWFQNEWTWNIADKLNVFCFVVNWTGSFSMSSCITFNDACDNCLYSVFKEVQVSKNIWFEFELTHFVGANT